MSERTANTYKYRPVLFFVMAYVFTWVFWIPSIFLPESISPVLMLIGLLAPAAVSTVFIMKSGSDALKNDLKNRLIGFYKVKWRNIDISHLIHSHHFQQIIGPGFRFQRIILEQKQVLHYLHDRLCAAVPDAL